MEIQIEAKTDEQVLADLIIHAREDLRLAELKAVELRYFHTAEDCKNIGEQIRKLVKSR